MRASDAHLIASASVGPQAVGVPRAPVGVDAVHLADGAAPRETVHQRQERGMAFPLKHVEAMVGRLARPDQVGHHLVPLGLPHVVEDAAPPRVRALAFDGAAVFDDRHVLPAVVVPAERATLVDGVQRVNDDQRAGHRNPRLAAAVAEALEQLRFGRARQAARHHPGRDRLHRGLRDRHGATRLHPTAGQAVSASRRSSVADAPFSARPER